MRTGKIALAMLLVLAVLCFGAQAEEQVSCAHDAGWNIEGDGLHSCKLCGETFAHEFGKRVVEATCQSVGYAMNVCRDCGYEGEQFDVQPVDTNAHIWGDWIVEQQATCVAAGSRRHICQICGREETQEIPLAEHSMLEIVIAPDCVNDGYTVYVCEVCGTESEKTDIVPPSAAYHRWGEFEIVALPTCTTAGEQVRTCKTCGAKHRQEIEATGHAAETIVVEPGCEDGYTMKICSVCGEELSKHTDIVPAVHQWGEWKITVEAGCEEEGEEARVCALCGAEETRAVAPIGHKSVAITQESSCDQDGYTVEICSICGEELSERTDIVPATHRWGEWATVVEAKCEEEGEETRACELCGAEETRAVEPVGHVFAEITQAPSCNQDGYTVKVCERCGWQDGDAYQVVPASDAYHVWDKEHQVNEREATCTRTGIYRQTCTVCGSTRKVFTAMLKHQGVETVFEKTFAQDGYTVLMCSACGNEVGSRYDIVKAGMYSVEMQESPVLDLEIVGAQNAVLLTAVSEEGEIAAILEVYTDDGSNVELDFDDAWYEQNHVCRVMIASQSVVVTAEAEGKLLAQIACEQETDELFVYVQANLSNEGFDEAVGAYEGGVYNAPLFEEGETTLVGRYISVEVPKGPGMLQIKTLEEQTER